MGIDAKLRATGSVDGRDRRSVHYSRPEPDRAAVRDRSGSRPTANKFSTYFACGAKTVSNMLRID